jgi:hypothetical protein
MTLTQSKTEFLTESLVEQLNNREKVNSLESSRSCYTNFEYEVGRKYIKVWSYLISDGEKLRGRSCFMFIDKESGACYKPASHKAPAKGIRFYIDFLTDHTEIVDPYGSFLYLR